MAKTKKGYTLLELLIVVAVFGIIMSALFSSITYSRSSFQNAGYQIDRQQDARRAVDKIAWELKKSSPVWEMDGGRYSVSINEDGDQLDFYVPVFDEDNQITELKAVRYYMNTANTSQMLRKEGIEDAVVAANNIYNTASQKPFFTFNDPIVVISIPVVKNNTVFTLTTQANLRNRDVQLGEEVTVEEIDE
ncbi:MAG: type II secretion system protein [Candidatus Omnitrophica bacterium]|nr:type II secretion system protein [Candidatus Omnitrophota bacterium]